MNDADNTQVSASQPLDERVNNRSQRPSSDAFKAFMASNWAPSPEQLPERDAVAGHAAARRRAISEQFKGERLVIPAGPLKVRSNDCDYRFRPHSGFAHLTGLGLDHELMPCSSWNPRGKARATTAATTTRHCTSARFAGRDTEQFYADSRSASSGSAPAPPSPSSRPASAWTPRTSANSSWGSPRMWAPRKSAGSPSGWCARSTKTSTPSWTPRATTRPRTRRTWTWRP